MTIDHVTYEKIEDSAYHTTAEIRFTYQTMLYSIDIVKDPRTQEEFITSLYHWEDNNPYAICPYCQQNHGRCQGLFVYPEHIRALIKDVLSSPSIRLTLILHHTLSFEHPQIRLDEHSTQDIAIVHQKLDALANEAKKRRHSIAELALRMDGYVSGIQKNPEQNVPSEQLVVLTDFNAHSYLHYASVDVVQRVARGMTNQRMLYKDIPRMPRMLMEDFDQAYAFFFQHEGIQTNAFDDRMREMAWRRKMLDKQYKKIPEWEKSDDLLRFEEEFYEKREGLIGMFSYFQEDAYLDVHALQQQIIDYYYEVKEEEIN